MRITRLGKVALATGGTFVVLGSVAAAKTNTLTGEFQNDDNGTVEMKVTMKKTNSGKLKPKSIKSVEVAGLDFFCSDGEEGELAGIVTGPFPLEKESGLNGPSYSFNFESEDQQGRTWTVRSLPDSDGVNKNGTFSRGSISSDFQQPAVPGPGMANCTTGISNIYTAEK